MSGYEIFPVNYDWKTAVNYSAYHGFNSKFLRIEWWISVWTHRKWARANVILFSTLKKISLIFPTKKGDIKKKIEKSEFNEAAASNKVFGYTVLFSG